MAAQGKSARPNWPALDGLRCLAVVAVMLYHADLQVAAEGFAGVDVFFVLSGFLITALLLVERDEDGTISLKAFYARRALRLYPALVGVVVFVLLVALATQEHIRAVGEGALATLFYVANIWIDTGHDTIFLQHTWTLALEEQFYLLWPPLFLILTVGTRWRVWLTAILVASVVIALAASPMTGSSAAIRATYFRASGLVLGCGLAWVVLRRGARVPAWLGVIASVGLMTLLLSPKPFLGRLLTSGLSPAALVTVPVILSITGVPSVSARFFSGTALRWIGRRSYGLYLWHFPILSLALHHTPAAIPHAARAVAGLAASFAAAALSFRWIETPFLRRKRRFERLRPAPSQTPVTADVG